MPDFLKPFEEAARWFLLESHAITGSWGLSIILLGVAVKMLMLPFAVQQTRQSRAMSRLQPQLKDLQRRHKDDREKLAQAQMELYREHGVNPLGGCLPLLIQMPVLFGLYRAIRALDVHAQSFLWIPDLAQPEPLPPHGIPILIGLMLISQVLYQKFAVPPPSDPQQESMMRAMQFTAYIFPLFLIKFPAALVLYYTTFNIVSVGQQLLINRRYPVESPGPAPAQTEGDGRVREPLAEAASDYRAPQREGGDAQQRRRGRRRKKSRG